MSDAFDPLIEFDIQQIIAEGTARAIEQGTKQILQRFEGFVGKLGQEMGNKEDLTRAHQQVGEAMRKAVVNSYAQTVTARKKANLGYRPIGADGDGRTRRFTGKLLPLLRDQASMVQADARGIGFIDNARLNKEAAHWARLNFGAGNAGKGTHEVRLRLFGQFVGSIGFDEPVRSPVRLPPGFWFSPRDGKWVKPSAGGHRDAFFVAGANQPGQWKTVSIRGRHFLEAGLDRMRVDLPKAYEDLLLKWVARAANRSK